MEQDVYRMALRVAIRHPKFRMYGISRHVPEFNFMKYADMSYGQAEFPMVDLQYMASDLQVIIHGDLSSFEPVNAVPEFIQAPERKHIEDFKIFRPLNAIKEIVVARPQVSDLLEQIIQKQDPKQQEIREKKRRDMRKIARSLEGMTLDQIELIKPDEELVAQIVAVA